MLKNYCFILSVILLFWGCSTSEKVSESQTEEVKYTIVYIIHADANYTYHVNGKKRMADIDALNRAIKTARSAKHGEVFIFYQKPESKLLFLIPKKDRTYYHYRNGELIGGTSYSPRGGGLASEAQIFNSFRSDQSTRDFFLYFGHEIPSGNPDFAYHQSQPDKQFNTNVFAEDLKKFKARFEITVLSTCNNGNPLMAEALTGQTDYLIASPQNLHLSHLTDKSFQQLENNPDISVSRLAQSIARSSFVRLSGYLRTTITIAVYNLDETKSYIQSKAEKYRSYLQNVHQTSLFVENVDCAKLPVFKRSLPQKGVTHFYKPPAFGKKSQVSEHSGWGCKM